ncbi:MAG: Rrf2 family transcriptional regulator [candidate division Zixibacteria bacterium]|nr:Rrf2 family transcriptional regulator [candidate division Zixibacteria bacterium]
MQFTKAEEYGIMGVIHLGKQDKARIVPLSEIAEVQGVPEKFLAKIFQGLTKAGIVRSHRGVKGGFSLGKNPELISVKEVIEAIQGPYHLIKCLHDKNCCDKYGDCPIRIVLAEAEEKLLGVFNHYTIDDLLKWKAEKKSA